MNRNRISLAANWLIEERAAQAAGYLCIAGIDEAGRGALAGPVVAACVVLPFEQFPPGLNDSKQLNPEQREALYAPIIAIARGVGVGIVNAGTVDRINILRATHQAMRMALKNLPYGLRPDLALIDGLPVIPFPLTQWALIKGDGRSASIAAASIIAKVTRDRLMTRYALEFPAYGFEAHKGYGAPTHLRALQEHGPCALHRRTFRPVAVLIEPQTPAQKDEPDVPRRTAPSKSRKRGRNDSGA